MITTGITVKTLTSFSVVATRNETEEPPPVEVRKATSPYQIMFRYSQGWEPAELSELTEYDSNGVPIAYGRIRGEVASWLSYGLHGFIRHEDNPNEHVQFTVDSNPVRGYYYGEDTAWSVDFKAWGSIFALGDLNHAGEVSHTLPAVGANAWY